MEVDCMNLNDIFKDSVGYEPVPAINLEERIKILGLSKERVEELRNMPVKEVQYNSDGNYQNVLDVIDTDKIVGLARCFWDNNWLDVLSEKYCHKVRNFTMYDADTFDMVLQCEHSDDYPSVVEYQGEYYISGNGLHRLTIAKCLGNKKARVVVQREMM